MQTHQIHNMKQRKYPLFIIDTERSHGRSIETDYLACTSNELPFVAELKVITEEDYNEEYDPNHLRHIRHHRIYLFLQEFVPNPT